MSLSFMNSTELVRVEIITLLAILFATIMRVSFASSAAATISTTAAFSSIVSTINSATLSVEVGFCLIR